MELNYLEALMLREIAAGPAELYNDREPKTLYINGYPAGNDRVTLAVLDKIRNAGLLEIRGVDGPLETCSINEEGIAVLRQHFPAKKLEEFVP